MAKAFLQQSDDLLGGKCVYHARSMELELYSGYTREHPHGRYSWGGVTLTLDSKLAVIGIGSYSPKESWTQSAVLTKPATAKNGRLCLDVKLDENGIAGEKTKPSGYCNPHVRLIKLCVEPSSVTGSSSRFADNGMCELDLKGNLMSIYFENLETLDD